jgi:hypothetical protein
MLVPVVEIYITSEYDEFRYSCHYFLLSNVGRYLLQDLQQLGVLVGAVSQYRDGSILPVHQRLAWNLSLDSPT